MCFFPPLNLNNKQFRYWKTALLLSIITPLLSMLLLQFIIIVHRSQVGIGKGIYHPPEYTLSGIENCLVSIYINYNSVNNNFISYFKLLT